MPLTKYPLRFTKSRPMAFNHFIIVSVVAFLALLDASVSQNLGPPAASGCNGIFLSYNYTGGFPIPPNDTANQPYRFQSTLNVVNNGLDELRSWQVFVGFQHGEILVSSDQAILADGTSLPAKVGNNGTFLAGFPKTDLKTAVETAGDPTQTTVQVQLVGTEFGVGAPGVPLPASLYLANDGYSCPNYTMEGNTTMNLCCTRNPSSTSNSTLGDGFLPRQEGDLIIMYDVIKSFSTDYWAQVTISNHNPLGRLNNWQLSWDWARDEFIFAMRGAYPTLVDTTDCLFGKQGQHYQDLDFSSALNCERRPTIMDLPPSRANDTNLGLVPFCCRNGTILSALTDPDKSKSTFLMHVYKMPPDLNRTALAPPVNWQINGTMSSNYQCGQPIPVSPSDFPDPTGLPSETMAISSWQVVCNLIRPRENPKCCVSFSAFYNDSVVPCNTCACGCNNVPSNTCRATAPALLLRPETLLIPFENRTKEALAWSKVNRWPVPDPLPCGDNCGVSINWHLLSDYRNGWTARISVFNWGDEGFADWSVAAELDRSGAGFQEAYSFNGTLLGDYNNTILLKGLQDFNYLIAEKNGSNPRKDPPVPGSQQSVILFSKKETPGVNLVAGDGFPTKVLFNGEECAIPRILPSSGHKMSASASETAVVFSLVTLLVLLFWH
ncbi:hypothetical protein ACJRO7_009139 [Eucalyptus globulus]|uniref:COBRA C-terminal domain-containing protein n=1 Tax=Eucalyptus globulus TaxID=34317 RepID=A0ABD3IU25_EUCGL